MVEFSSVVWIRFNLEKMLVFDKIWDTFFVVIKILKTYAGKD